MNWETLCKTREEGGAGLRRVVDMNMALLAKLAWRTLVCGEETWCKVLRGKYGVAESNPPFLRHKNRESYIWRAAMWGLELLQRGLRWRVGDGKRTLFWVDNWIEEGC